MVETVSSLPLIIKKKWLKNRTSTSIYSWTSLQRPPWGQKKVAALQRWLLWRSWNESECMDCPPNKNSRFRYVGVVRGSTVDFTSLPAPGHFINAHVFFFSSYSYWCLQNRSKLLPFQLGESQWSTAYKDVSYSRKGEFCRLLPQ